MGTRLQDNRGFTASRALRLTSTRQMGGPPPTTVENQPHLHIDSVGRGNGDSSGRVVCAEAGARSCLPVDPTIIFDPSLGGLDSNLSPELSSESNCQLVIWGGGVKHVRMEKQGEACVGQTAKRTGPGGAWRLPVMAYSRQRESQSEWMMNHA